mmetsp:Transcript_12875/g.30544  ORF Transcript_12875/g.30544 Transcript_12875/m.30544 type:complete len:98 (+) Transcript_12875:159-452(+)
MQTIFNAIAGKSVTTMRGVPVVVARASIARRAQIPFAISVTIASAGQGSPTKWALRLSARVAFPTRDAMPVDRTSPFAKVAYRSISRHARKRLDLKE